MKFYLIIALVAWALYGVLSIIDKFLLNKPINDARVYTYYTGLVSIFMFLIFAPWMRFHSVSQVLFDISAGLIFLVSQYCLFVSIIGGSVSEVVPITGALVPIFTLILANYGLHISLTPQQVAGFVFLVGGTVVISYKAGHKKILPKPQNDLQPSTFKVPIWLWAVASSLFAAVYFTMAKIAYDPFKENFGLVRFGSFLGSTIMLASPHVRSAVFGVSKQIGKSKTRMGTSGLFIAKSILSGLGFIILNYAISRGNPALVNALQGVEYVVIFLLAVFLSRSYPKVLKEETSHRLLVQKTVAVLMIFIGFILLQIT